MLPSSVKYEKEDKFVKPRSASLQKAQTKYYKKNKEKITAKQMKYNETYNKKDYVCDCGSKIKISSKHHHMKSKKHIKKMDELKSKDGSE